MLKKSGDLAVEIKEPIFSGLEKWSPGWFREGSFLVTNLSPEPQKLYLKSGNATGSTELAQTLNLFVKSGQNKFYGFEPAKNLADFWQEDEIDLMTLPGKGVSKVDLTLVFDAAAGNFYQDKSLSFNLIVGLENSQSEISLTEVLGSQTQAYFKRPLSLFLLTLLFLLLLFWLVRCFLDLRRRLSL